MQARWLVGSVLLFWWVGLLCAGGGGRDSSHEPDEPTSAEHGAAEGRHEARRALHSPVGFVFDGALKDAIEFFKPHESGNGHSCATCHRAEDHFG
jgi:hypothetical protein